MSDNIIESLQRILDGEETPPPRVSNQVILLALVHINTTQRERYEAMEREQKELKKEIKDLKTKNPVVRIGEFMRDYPKIALVMGSVLMILLCLAIWGGFENIPPEVWEIFK